MSKAPDPQRRARPTELTMGCMRERIPQTRILRFGPLNHHVTRSRDCGTTLSPTEGEHRVSGQQATGEFKENHISLRVGLKLNVMLSIQGVHSLQ